MSDIYEFSYLLIMISTSFVLIFIFFYKSKCFRFHLGLLDSFPLVCFSFPPYYKETEDFFLVDWYFSYCFLGVTAFRVEYMFAGIYVLIE